MLGARRAVHPGLIVRTPDVDWNNTGSGRDSDRITLTRLLVRSINRPRAEGRWGPPGSSWGVTTMSHAASIPQVATKRAALGLYSPTVRGANVARWRINGYRAMIIIWT